MKNYKILLVTGYEDSQKHSISIEEAHKAYYLFLNPSKRGIFSNGLAITGKEINNIVPDWHGTMGWNRTHQLDTDDWNEINEKGIERTIKLILAQASDIAVTLSEKPELANKLLSEIIDIKKIEPKKETRMSKADFAKYNKL